MATIYQKTVTDKTVILSPREYIMRAFDFSLWTEMRFGIYFTGVTSGGDNTDSVNETVALSTSADRITFGLKNSSTNDLPGVAGGLFLGCVTQTGLTSDCTAASNFRSNGGGPLCAAGYNGVTLIGGGAGQAMQTMQYPAASGATGYNGFYAMKFVISNRGAATQSVDISDKFTATISGTDYSASALRTDINNAVYGSAISIAWNSGGVALTVPDAIWIRMPFYNNRIRISCMRAIRYAP